MIVVIHERLHLILRPLIDFCDDMSTHRLFVLREHKWASLRIRIPTNLLCLSVRPLVHDLFCVEIRSPLSLLRLVYRGNTRIVRLDSKSTDVSESEEMIDDLIVENIGRYTTTIKSIECSGVVSYGDRGVVTIHSSLGGIDSYAEPITWGSIDADIWILSVCLPLWHKEFLLRSEEEVATDYRNQKVVLSECTLAFITFYFLDPIRSEEIPRDRSVMVV